jgi:succinate dehydrogenase / fumarate reductase, iron-sulfur subunit
MSDSFNKVETNAPAGKSFQVRVLRQDGPAERPYWERHRVAYEPNMNCISVLQKIAEGAVTVEGKRVAPVAWECNCLEEVCGACTMLINGRVRQACTALVDQLLDIKGSGVFSASDEIKTPDPFIFIAGEIELRPATKFPVIRDLLVDRSRMFACLEKILAWLPVDSYLDMGSGPRQSQETQQMAYLYSKCMTCGCCLEACPQFLKIELAHSPGESDEEYRARQRTANMRSFMGAHAIAQVELFNSNPIGAMNSFERLEALVAEGGIQTCGNAQNCVKVCPKEIPLTTAIGRGGRAATLHTLRKWFDR